LGECSCEQKNVYVCKYIQITCCPPLKDLMILSPDASKSTSRMAFAILASSSCGSGGVVFLVLNCEAKNSRTVMSLWKAGSVEFWYIQQDRSNILTTGLYSWYRQEIQKMFLDR